MLLRIAAAFGFVFLAGMANVLFPLTNVWGAGLFLSLLATVGVVVISSIEEKTFNTWLLWRYVLVGLATLVVVLIVPGGLLPLILPTMMMGSWPPMLASLVLTVVGTLVGELLHRMVPKPNPIVVEATRAKY